MAKDGLKIVIGAHRLVNALDLATGALVRRYGLTLGQFAVLEALYHKGEMTVGEVRDKILSSSGTIPMIVKNLEKQGLITRRVNEADRRSAILSLTDEGRALIAEVYPQNEALLLEMLSVYSEAEQAALANLLKKFGG
ncbi:MAG: MarR family transcriptional regulator [Peptococcaceae bacterium]|nr:MarR family transcriptional regulator [Peptococcaceae bacterium]